MDKATRLKLAVQKSGRLTDHSLDILGRCGLKLARGKDQLIASGLNMPLDVLFLVGFQQQKRQGRNGKCSRISLEPSLVLKPQTLDKIRSSPQSINRLKFPTINAWLTARSHPELKRLTQRSVASSPIKPSILVLLKWMGLGQLNK